jgi:hypothetical protein
MAADSRHDQYGAKKIGPLDIGRAVLSRCVPLALLPEGVSGEAVALTGCLPSPPVEMKISPRRPDGEEESYFFFFLAAFLAGLAAAAFFFLAMIRSSERKNSVRSLYRSFASSKISELISLVDKRSLVGKQ